MEFNTSRVNQAISAIALVGSTLEKQRLLKELYDSDPALVTSVLLRAYDPHVTYGVRELPIYADLPDPGTRQFTNDTWSLLDRLSSRALSGNNARDAIRQELTCLDDQSQQLLVRILRKDMNAGLAVTTINKVSKGLIPSTPYMRCSLLDEEAVRSWPWADGVYVQTKADGMYVDVNQDDDTVWLNTRAGQVLPSESFATLIEECKHAFYATTQTHGELLVVGPDGKDLSRKTGNGILNSVAQGGAWPEGHYPRLLVWDQIPIEASVPKGRVDTTYRSRRVSLDVQIGLAHRTRPLTVVGNIHGKRVYSLAEAFAFCREEIAKGEEGAIMKHPDMPWRDTGSGAEKMQVKLKVEARCEVRVKAMLPGKATGKNANLFGSLACESEDGAVEVNIPGFTDKKRKEIFDNWDKYDGSVIAIVFNDLIYSESKKTFSLFLPRFDEERPDKTVADTKDQIEQQFKKAMLVENRIAPKPNRIVRSRRP